MLILLKSCAQNFFIDLPVSLAALAICVLATLSPAQPETGSTADSPPVWAGEEEADGLSSLRRAR